MSAGKSYDVGVRKSVESHQVKYWLFVSARVIPVENLENNFTAPTYKIYKPIWSRYLDVYYWKIFVIVTILLNTTFFPCYVWITPSSVVIPVIVIMHLTCLVYWIDFIMIVCSTNKPKVIKLSTKLQYAVDGISLIPLSVVYCIWMGRKINYATLWWLRAITLVRIYRIPRFLLQVSQAEKIHWRMSIMTFISIFCLFIFTYGNIFLQHVDEYNYLEIAYWNSTLTNEVIVSMYYVFEIVFGVAYGDIKPQTYVQRVISCFAMSFGAFMTMGVFTGIMTIAFTNNTKNRESYRYDFEGTMSEFRHRKIEKKVLERLRDNMQMLWDYTKGYINSPPVEMLPLALQKEIFFDINFAFLDRSLIFRMRPRSFLRSLIEKPEVVLFVHPVIDNDVIGFLMGKHMGRRLYALSIGILIVALRVKCASYLPGDIILEAFSVADAMICVSSGVIEILSEENDETPLLSLTTGTILGEASLFFSRPAPCFLRASTYVELQVLKKKDFSQLALKFPEIIRSIRDDIWNRIAKTREIKTLDNDSQGTDSTMRDIQRRKRAKVFLNAWKESRKEKAEGKSEMDLKKEILNLYVLSENIPRVKTLPIDVIRAKPWILRPHTNFTKFWHVFLFLVILFAAIAIPLWAAYHRKITPDMHVALIWIKVVYLIDLYLECTTAVERKDHFTYDTTLKQIIRHKLKTFGFYIDILSAYYLSIYADLVWPSQSEYADLLLSLNSILKIWRLVRYFKQLENTMRFNLLLTLTLKYIISFTIMAVWGAVLLYLIACPGSYCNPNRWYYRYKMEFEEKGYDESMNVGPIPLSLYYATMTLFTVGFGDVIPTSVPDCIGNSFCIILGVIIINISAAEITTAFKHLARIRTAYQENIFNVGRFMKELDIPTTLQKSTMDFLRLQWDYDRGYALEKHFKLEKSLSLQKRILLFQVANAISSLPIFKDANPEFIKFLAKLSQLRVLPPNSDILRAGIYFRGMYVLENGYCEISNETDYVKKIIGPVNSFGIAEMILGIPLSMTVYTLTHVRIIAITYSAYMTAVTKYPGAKAQIENVINQYKAKNTLADFINTFANAQMEKTDSKIAITNFFSKPILNVLKHQKGIKSSYWTPFEAWGKFQFLQIFLLPYVMTPECLQLKIIMSLRIINALLLAILAPIQFCFPRHVMGFMIFITIQQGIAALSLYVMLHVAYYDERGLLMYHPAKTAPRYLKSSFALDLLSIFPYSLVRWWSLTDKSAPPNIFVDGPGFILVLHIYKFIQGCQYLEENILRQTEKVKILKYIPLAFMLVNSISGFLILLFCVQVKYIEDSKLPGVNALGKDYQRGLNLLCSRGPYNNETLDDLTAFRVYITTVYWVTSTMTNTGFGDIVAYKEIIMIAIIGIVIFGLFYLSYMYANISSNMISTGGLISKHRTNILRLKKFMERHGVNPELQKRLIFHYEFNWLRTEGETPQNVFKNLNAMLREKLISSTYESSISQTRIFGTEWKKVITRLIADHLNEIHFLRGEIIVKYNDTLKHIYLIHRGKVNLLSESGSLITTMGCGGLFGNISNKPFALSSEVVVAEDNVDVLMIDCKEFFTFLQELPSAKTLINELTSIQKNYIEPKPDLNTTSEVKINVYHIRIQGVENPKDLAAGYFYLKRTVFVPKNEKKLSSFIILPGTTLYNALEIFFFLMSYLSVFLASYAFAFQEKHVSIYVLSYLLDFLFCIKIFLEFHITYFDKFRDCVTSNKDVIKRYLKSKYIIFDIASTLPFELFVFIKFDYLLLTALRLNRLLRMYHIFVFYSSKHESFMINRIYLQTAWIVLVASLMVHVFACVWFLSTSPLGYSLEPTWVTAMNLTTLKNYELYFYSLYHIIMVTVGSGMLALDIYSIPEMTLDIVFMFVSRLCVVLLASDLSAAIYFQKWSLFSYQQKITELKSVMIRHNISEYQLAKMWHYATTLWLTDHGKQLPKYLLRAPYAIKCEVMYEMFGSHLRECHLFANLSETILRQLAVQVRRYVYFTGNYIVQQGDIDETLYFIHKGEISVLTIHSNFMETIHFTLAKNDYFGVRQGYIRGTPHAFSYRVEKNAEILSLTLSDWKHLLKYFPEMEQYITKAIDSIPKKKSS